MKILSINVGQTSTLEINGKPTATAIQKRPVGSAVDLYDTHLAGDQQADLKNHGGKSKAVYAFGHNHYAYWENYLAKPLSYGALGENLSMSELNEHEIFIGDEYAINNAVIVATQFRQPCFKLGALHQAADMPTDFIQYGYSGVYFSVAKTGTIKAGDSLQLINRKQQTVSIYNLFEACFKPLTEARIEVLVAAETLVDLPDEWKRKIKNRLANSQ